MSDILVIESISDNISVIECAGNTFRKNFTVSNPNDHAVQFILYLSQSSSFYLFPNSVYSGGLQTLQCEIFSGGYLTFSVINNSVNDGDTAFLYSSVAIIPLGHQDQEIIGTTIDTALQFVGKNPAARTRRELGSLLSVDKSNNPIISQSTNKITQFDSSFGIARTNPKLTGNVKITVDSTNNIWLNSIDASKELSSDKFKKYKLSPNSSYAVDLKNFFDNGKTPTDTVFFLYQVDTQQYTSTKRSLSEQYDRFYQYGVEPLVSKFYDENLSFFAPLYVKNDVPEYFVIFRTEGPINKFSYDKPFDEWSSSIIREILDNSVIIKTFSLKDDSQIGKYIRNIINHPARKSSELTVSFQQNGYTSFNGVSYREGSFAQKGELLYDYYNQENPISSTEEFLTSGFERNGIITSNILNIEFLFNDISAEEYSINRYFGLYVNAIDLAKFSIDENAFVEYSKEVGQTPIPRKNVDISKISQNSFTQTNLNGIQIYADTNAIDSVSNTDIFSSIVSSVQHIPYFTIFTLNIPGNIQNKLILGQTCTVFTENGASGSCQLMGFYYMDDITVMGFYVSSFTGVFPIESIKTIDFYNDDNFNEFKLSMFDNEFIESSGRIFYIKDKKGFLHNVKSSGIVYSHDNFGSQKNLEFTLHDTSLDMSVLTGFYDISTQTPAIVLEDKGKASLYIDINKYFYPNDYIEIKWENGPTSGNFPMRWRAIANSTVLQSGESWPSCGINTDSEGEYYFSYFHPGNSDITLEKFVTSIKESFDRFPFKNFEVLAKNTTLYFKSTQDGISSEKTQFIFNNHESSFSVMGITAPSSGSVNFIGASDRKFVRAKIDKTIANGISLDEYLSTQGSFSLLRQYKIFDEVIISAPYIDKPVYDFDDKLIDFVDCDNFHSIVLENESQKIQTTYDKKITAYDLFKPSIGVLSIFPFRDFDMDFHYSEYVRNYMPELIEYFGRYNDVMTVVSSDIGGIGSTYSFNIGASFDTYPTYSPFLVLSDGSSGPILFEDGKVQLMFSEAGLTAFAVDIDGLHIPITIPIGTNILLMPARKSLYFSENELAKFKGFISLSSIVTSDDEERFKLMENVWDPKRFTFQLLDSEYDRLSENYLKTICLKSRVVPYINKWVQDNRNIRDNAYRFNYSRAFGTMNFSPSISQDISDPKFHTHEWPYLDSVPDTFDLNYNDNVFSYMFDNISDKYDFTSTKFDWFSAYFVTGYPTELADMGSGFENYKSDISEKYSTFKYQYFTNRTFTMFRGQKIEISSSDPLKYDGYRFSTIIKMEHNDNNNNEDAISFNTIVNEKWKFMIVVITVRSNSYRFPNGKLSYVDLYTLESTDYLATIDVTLPGTLPTYQIALPNDYKLSDPLDLSIYSKNSPDVNVFDVILGDHSYIPNLQEDITETIGGNYNSICASLESPLYELSVSLSNADSSYIFDTYLKLTSNTSYIKYPSMQFSIPTILPINFNWSNFEFFSEGGGYNVLNGLRDRLSFHEIMNVITGVSNKSNMIYDIYDMDGIHSTLPDFNIGTVSPDSLVRLNDYVPVSDSDKPSVFYGYTDIGAILNQIKDLQTIYRYPGDFSPKFRDVLKFWTRESENFTIATSTDFLLSNTRLGVELNDFGMLKNQYYNKVSDSEVLTISSSSGYTPVYPLIGEISIDKKDINAWSSTWDKNYYRHYISTTEFTEINGTESMKEIKSLFGSKAMKVPDFFDLYQFKTLKVQSQSLLKNVDEELTYVDLGTSCIIRVDVYSRLLREMLGTDSDTRAKTEFLRTIGIIPDTFDLATIDIKVREYLVNNIMNLFDIQDVKLYVLQTGNSGIDQISSTNNLSNVRSIIETTNDIVNGAVSLDETTLLNRQYVIKKNAKIFTDGVMVFKVDFPFDNRYYTSLSMGVSVRRI